ncbi:MULTISPECIES: hypothetical protein [unclassified Oceanobacillus]|uniref:hypothetical protein n=1 Tax=unclassified Oceanobacillus TaxID=2630292 RepID=UPI001BE7035F|nr:MULTISPECIES: hypothetical protein [unclassified Oceanobacillus]MBT2600912.1 hypothetical protein [Oceanobacillus sp. ISL-74]MBT2653427.1 hypothetical protein [Oceanobacillus sp. ISL-73]
MNINLSKKATKWLSGLTAGIIILLATVGFATAPYVNQKQPSEMMEFEVEIPNEFKDYLEQQEQPAEKLEGTFL